MGQGTSAGSTGNNQVANTVVGQGATSNVANGTALGQGAVVVNNGAVALGQGSTTDRDNVVSVGGGAIATRQITNVAAGTAGTDAVNLDQLNAALGTSGGAPAFLANNANGRNAPAASPADAVAGGYGASALGTQATAIGNRATAGENNATAIGYNATASLLNSVAIGQGSTATAASSAFGNPALGVRNNAGIVGIGSGSVFSIGGTGAERQIENVAAGAVTATSTNAVNGSQLFSVATNVNAVGVGAAAGLGGGAAFNVLTGVFTGPSYGLNGSGATYTNAVSGIQALANGVAGPLQYATPGTPSNALNLVGTGGPVTLGNVAVGALTATSTQAVNGAQLFATNQNVTALLTGSAGPFRSNNANGRPAASATGPDASAGGFGATANAAQATALGNTASATAAGASAFGFGATAGATNASAFGQGATANLVNAVALGNAAVATGASSIAGNLALGVRTNAGAVATGSGNVVSVGGAGAERQIQNVGAGAVTATSTDAVNGAQLFSLATNVNAVGAGAAGAIGGGAAYNAAMGAFTAPSYGLNGSGTTYANAVSGIQALASGAAGPVQYATPGTPSNSLNLVGTGAPVTLGNVAAGTVSATSSQAVTGAQLFATNQRTASALGGGAGVDANGLLTAPSYAVQGGTYNNVGGALGALDGQATVNTRSIASIQAGQSGPFRDNNASNNAAPMASGLDAIAGGFGSVASGSASTAIGTGAQATRAGATAIGAFAQATADPTTAVGFAAAATGNEASAFGAFATASGTNSTALGRSATAVGDNSTAVGFAATAAQANSVAIGMGVATTRANQVAIGTNGQTYTMAGLTSAQSLAAQSGATGFVTTDAAGNLAASTYGPAKIAQMDGRISTLESGFGTLSQYAHQSRREARQGIATALALSTAPMPSAPGKLSYTLNGATFRGEFAAGGAVAYRLDTNMPLAVTAGISAAGGGNVGVRFGVTGEL